jgi:hypothetical protein
MSAGRLSRKRCAVGEANAQRPTAFVALFLSVNYQCDTEGPWFHRACSVGRSQSEARNAVADAIDVVLRDDAQSEYTSIADSGAYNLEQIRGSDRGDDEADNPYSGEAELASLVGPNADQLTAGARKSEALLHRVCDVLLTDQGDDAMIGASFAIVEVDLVDVLDERAARIRNKASADPTASNTEVFVPVFSTAVMKEPAGWDPDDDEEEQPYSTFSVAHMSEVPATAFSSRAEALAIIADRAPRWLACKSRDEAICCALRSQMAQTNTTAAAAVLVDDLLDVLAHGTPALKRSIATDEASVWRAMQAFGRVGDECGPWHDTNVSESEDDEEEGCMTMMRW